jgi:hypothetical protein
MTQPDFRAEELEGIHLRYGADPVQGGHYPYFDCPR